MSNKKAVSDYYKKMRAKGFQNLSFIVHKDDVETVKALVNELKQKRLSVMIITPEETKQRLKVMNLSDQQFQRIHHKVYETVNKHIEYLKDIQKYQENKNNYVVAKRIKCITELMKDGINNDKAIIQCVNKHPF